MAGKNAGPSGCLIALVLSGVFYVMFCTGRGPSPPRQPSPSEVPTREQSAAATQLIQTAKSSGLITAWSPWGSRHEAQVDPYLWSQTPVDTKRVLVRALQIDAGSSTASVTVIDRLSGRELATVSWTGAIDFH